MEIMDGHLMRIRKTTDNDIERVMEIYVHAKKFMEYIHKSGRKGC